MTPIIIGGTVIAVKITFDAAKRAAVLETRGIDMRDAAKVFEGPTATVLDGSIDRAELMRRISR